jgi:hypothetical protein
MNREATVEKDLQIVSLPEFNAVLYHHGLKLFLNALLGVEANGIMQGVLSRSQRRRGDVEVLLGFLNPFAENAVHKALCPSLQRS